MFHVFFSLNSIKLDETEIGSLVPKQSTGLVYLST